MESLGDSLLGKKGKSEKWKLKFKVLWCQDILVSVLKSFVLIRTPRMAWREIVEANPCKRTFLSAHYQNVLKTFWKHSTMTQKNILPKSSERHCQFSCNYFSSAIRLKDVLTTSWRRIAKIIIFKDICVGQDVLKTSSRQNAKTETNKFPDILKMSSLRLFFAGMIVNFEISFSFCKFALIYMHLDCH